MAKTLFRISIVHSEWLEYVLDGGSLPRIVQNLNRRQWRVLQVWCPNIQKRRSKNMKRCKR